MWRRMAMKYIQVRHNVATMANSGTMFMADSLCAVDIDLDLDDACPLPAVDDNKCVGIFFIGRMIYYCLPGRIVDDAVGFRVCLSPSNSLGNGTSAKVYEQKCSVKLYQTNSTRK